MTPHASPSDTLVTKSFRISRANWDKLREVSRRRDRKPTEIVRKLVERYVRGDEAQRAA